MKNIVKTVGLALIFSFFQTGGFGQGLPQAAMYAHFINVGQADATLLEFPCGAILIDAGAQDANYEQQLLQYLRNFFARRRDLNNTLDLVFVTHCHIDHNLALDSVVADFHVREYIDNGVQTGSGRRNQLWLEKNAARLHIVSTSYSYEQATADGQHRGITNDTIEPLHCSVVTPQIYVLSGRFAHMPVGWSKVVFNDGNNHSLVIKVVFGKASFLFTGDLETDGIQQVMNYYAASGTLDVDVLRVGHHGSVNATTAAYLNAVTPLYAVISCGQWNYGIGPPPKAFTTYTYGHPGGQTIDLLSAVIPGNRTIAVKEKAGYGAKIFRDITVSKNIFATPWDGTVTIEATSDGSYTVQQ
ncbi:MAG: ComEC/Rec2 family competence protein [Sphingobacteriales bacterium]